MQREAKIRDISAVALAKVDGEIHFLEKARHECADLAVNLFLSHLVQRKQNQIRKLKLMHWEWGATYRSVHVNDYLLAAIEDLARYTAQPDRQAFADVACGGDVADAMAFAMQMELETVAFYQSLIAALPEYA